MEEHGGRGRGVGADRRGGASSISGDGFDFHTGDDRTPASAKVSQGGSGRASEKKKKWGVGRKHRRVVGAEWQQRARCGRTRQGSTRREEAM